MAERISLTMDKVEELLKKYWGYDELRPAQVKPIKTILEGKDVLGVMPTGYGKSICFQLPALLLPGTTIVFSPLISLMKDQVDKLREKGIKAEFLNSSLTTKEAYNVIKKVESGNIKLLYIAPERLRSRKFFSLIENLPISMVTIDEAHAVSEWGHQFRPYYMKIPRIYDHIKGDFIISGFTATATDFIRRDIIKGLKMREPVIHVSGFARPNIRLSTLELSGWKLSDVEGAKISLLREMVANEPGAKIIYCGSKRFCDTLYMSLMNVTTKIVKYHADMGANERKRAQEKFMGIDDAVCVATSAFGMGIDRPDIRKVVFSYSPLTMNDLYQGIGRAGRDGLPAEGLLLHSKSDHYLQEFFINTSTPAPTVVEDVYNYIVTQGQELKNGNVRLITKYAEIGEKMNLKDGEVSASVSVLNRKYGIASVDSRYPFIVRAKKPISQTSDGVHRVIAAKLNKPTVKMYPSEFGLRRGDLLERLQELKTKGFIDFIDVNRRSVIYLKSDYEEIPDNVLLAYSNFYKYRVREAALVRRYPFSGCRQRFILDYYGDTSNIEYCNCNFCKPKGDTL